MTTTTKPQDFRNLTTPIGKAAWAYVVEPREGLNPGEFSYELAVEIDESELARYAELAEAMLEQHRLDNPLFPKGNDKLQLPWVQSRGPKKANGQPGDLIPGKWLLKMKKRAETIKNGVRSKAKPPFLQDSAGFLLRPGQDIEAVTPGSTVRACFDFYAYNKGGNYGIGCGLRGVQVININQDDYRFDAVEGGFTVQPKEEEELPF